MVNMIIDGKQISAEENITIMEAAERNGIPIPKLCYLKGINEIAACRVCVVELEGKEKLKVFTEEFPYTEARPAVINEKSIDELITNAILEVDYGQSSAEDALTSLTQKLNENIASNYQ